MAYSYWKLHIDASKEQSARKVLNGCIKALGRPPLELGMNEYSKGGYMASLKLFHDEKMEWPELVYEVLSFGERIGNGWLLIGNVAESPSAVLNVESSSAHSRVSGLSWAEWQLEK